MFGKIVEYYEAFGTPADERNLHRDVKKFLGFLEECLAQPHLDDRIPVMLFCQDHPTFKAEFLETPYTSLGSPIYELPTKWKDRIARMEPAKLDKVPQTIEHWVEAYLKRVDARIEKDSAKSRRYKMANFKKYADLQSHISVIDNKYVETYHRHVEQSSVVRDTKISYFEAFKMMTRWCGRQDDCDLVTPTNLDSREYTFTEPMGTGRKRMQKKKLLWTKEEFDVALKLPEPYRCYCLLMLNCGFRHKDISELQHDDLHLNEGRIVIQRNKLKQQATAPVICYPLWQKTIEAIVAARKNMPSDRVYVFRNEDGGPVEGALKTWWTRNKHDHNLGHKRLDMLRKTGSTIIARFNQHLDEMYLGETLSTTTKIHYSFADGEPNHDLDKAIAHLGAQFGLAEEPTQTVELSADALEMLRRIQKSGKITKEAAAALKELNL
ncbi:MULTISPECIES: tyrosine-type recombinase/integrase [Pirellulaceae]|uniref:tyrosine-type recombinase/integrase n=1 Tax=Pirellulaceae TaxID=2691357 RepID=UPI001304CA2E|nr:MULTISPECIES: tyrosine-type recombinase/integrase [Pirellulaceae]